ncbi:MAG: PIN domain-containing protein [Pseudomonadota bacterium]
MKKLFFDTNVVMDVYLPDRPGYKSVEKILDQVKLEKVNLFCARHTLSILEYTGKRHVKGEILNTLRNAVSLFEIPATGKIHAQQAFNYFSGDYEDAMQIQTAVLAKADIIITNDKSGGFDKSPIPVMTTVQYLKKS